MTWEVHNSEGWTYATRKANNIFGWDKIVGSTDASWVIQQAMDEP